METTRLWKHSIFFFSTEKITDDEENLKLSLWLDDKLQGQTIVHKDFCIDEYSIMKFILLDACFYAQSLEMSLIEHIQNDFNKCFIRRPIIEYYNRVY